MADHLSASTASTGGVASAQPAGPRSPWLRFLDRIEPSLGPLEAAYRLHYLSVDRAQALVAIVVGLCALVFFIYVDYGFFGWGPDFIKLLVLRASMAVLAVWLYRRLSRVTVPHQADRYIFASEMLVGITAMYVNLSRPPTYWQSPLVDMLMVLCYYTIIPQPLPYRLAAGVGLSLGSAGVLIFTKVGIPPLTLLIAVASLVMANGLGLLVSTRLFNYRRNQYKALVDQQAAAAALEWLATTDSLTGVLNRRSFLEAAEREMARFKRHGHVFSILIIDLDRFKDLNDTYGHQAGDQALRGFTDLVSRIGRDADTFGRLGGEEFGLLMPETALAEARLAAERIRRACQTLDLSLEGDRVPLTLSAGLVQVTPADANLDGLMRRADQALYRAKQAGRNRIDSAE